MVKYRYLLILGIGFAGACVTTRPDAAEPQSKSLPGQLAHPFLWAVKSHDGGRPAGYLLGTVHVAVDARKELPERVWQAFNAADCFVMEADQEQMDPRAVLAMARQKDGRHLSAEVTPEVWKKLIDKLAAMVPAAVLDQSQAWFAGLAYMQTLLPHDVDPMDGVLLGEAKKQGKKIQYLEDWREAMTAFASVTTAEDLADIVQNDADSKNELSELVKAYRSGDESAIEGAIKASNERGAGAARAAEKEKALLEGRNKAWLPRLAKVFAKDHCFVAVGTGHLVGSKGLPALLRGEGYDTARQR